MDHTGYSMGQSDLKFEAALVSPQAKVNGHVQCAVLNVLPAAQVLHTLFGGIRMQLRCLQHTVHMRCTIILYTLHLHL